MDNLERMKLRTGESNIAVLQDCLASARAAIMARRYPYGDWPDELESRYLDLQFRIALAIFNKQGGEFETAHSENGVSRSYGSEGIPQELLLEVTPMAKTVG
mgnify:FL=1